MQNCKNQKSIKSNIILLNYTKTNELKNTEKLIK